MTKRILSLFLTIAMICAFVPCIASAEISGTCGEDLTWVFDGHTETLTISGTGDMYDYEDTSSSPWHSYRDKIKTVEIIDGVTSIGDNAFYFYTKLTSVTIPDSVTSIGCNSFYSCTVITSLTIPDSVTFIDDGAFNWCIGLKDLTISKSVTTISNRAFANCTSLTNVFYSGSESDWNAISIADGNDPLLNATIYYANGETIFKEYTQDSMTYTLNTKNNTAELSEYSANSAQVSIPSSIIVDGVTYTITSIGDYAFIYCSNLTSITIPEGVTSIGDCAFRYCTSLTSVNLPDSLISIGGDAFWYCPSLTSITIPDSVTSIGDGAFWYCENLTRVDLPSGLTSISQYAFNACALTSITIPKNVTSIGYAAFAYCSSLTSVYYTGTEEEWNAITIGNYNEELLNASLHCNFGAQISGEYTLDGITYFDDTVTVAVSNTSDDAVTCQVYAGIYAADGTLKGVGMVDAVIDAGGGTVEIVLSAAIEDGDTVKAFMWYGTAPLAVYNSI